MRVAGRERMKVLVIDDNADLCANLRAGLEIEGYEVLTASNGEQGLKQLAEHKVDAVVTDLFMPDKDGIETIVELRKLSPKVKIVAMSGWTSTQGSDYLRVAREIGASVTLQKPFDPEELSRVVRQLAA